MNPERLSMLNPKCQSFSDTGGSFGAMTVSDLCACLSGCEPIGEFVVRRRYINPKERGKGFLQLLKSSIYLIYDKDVQPKRRGIVEPLLELCLDDYLGVNLCPKCKGTGEVHRSGMVKPCRSTLCIEGKRHRKDYEKAKNLGIKPMEYSRDCKKAYQVIDRYLTETLPEAESTAWRHINKLAKDL